MHRSLTNGCASEMPRKICENVQFVVVTILRNLQNRCGRLSTGNEHVHGNRKPVLIAGLFLFSSSRRPVLPAAPSLYSRMSILMTCFRFSLVYLSCSTGQSVLTSCLRCRHRLGRFHSPFQSIFLSYAPASLYSVQCKAESHRKIISPTSDVDMFGRNESKIIQRNDGSHS